MKYSGIDLHSNNSVLVVTNEADRVMLEKRMPNDLAAILAVLAPYRDELAGMVVESTFNWYWLVDGLQEAGYRVHLANTTAARIKSNDVKRQKVDGVVALGLRDDVTLAVQANVAVIETLNAQIDKLEKRLQKCVQPSPDYALLTSAPGIGRILAMTILLEVGTIERFKEVGHFASYARCVDSVRLSNGKKKGEGNAALTFFWGG
jgi:transposase